jgi:hypothetical protein
MRMLRFFLSYVLLNIFAILAAMFLAQNLRMEHLAFFGLDFTLNFVWILLGSVAFGFLSAFFLLLPGRIAAHIHSWSLDREAEELEKQVALLQQQREQMLSRLTGVMSTQERMLARYQILFAGYSRVVAWRDRSNAKMLGSAPIIAEAAAPPIPIARDQARAQTPRLGPLLPEPAPAFAWASAESQPQLFQSLVDAPAALATVRD